jgi:hypothetical protein
VKTVFLILYLWHADKIHDGEAGRSSGVGVGMNGGPVLKIEPMPSLKSCESVGVAVKLLVDMQEHSTKAAVYRCIEVNK